MGIRVVFLDVAGTLLTIPGGVGAQYAAVAARFGVTAPATALDAAFPAAFRAAPPMAFPGVAASAVPAREYSVWHGLVRQVFADAGLLDAFGAGRFDAYFDAVYHHFESPAVWAEYPDVFPALQALAGRGVELGVITNFDSRVLPLLAARGLARRFGSITLSSRVGAVKPDPAIFAAALAAHRAVPAEAVHVGDSPGEDAAGARAAGLAALLIDRAGRHAGASLPHGIHRIASLTEVARFL
jgi:putative hydrolase of the HAD superfamily